jgi:hypothetical protein
MNKIVMPDGEIKTNVSTSVADLLFSHGGRLIELQPIQLSYADQTGRSTGASEVPKPRRGRKPRISEGIV